MEIVPVVLAGGFGSRLWPLSRKSLPKQFLPLISEKTLMQETLLRVKGLKAHEPIVVCNNEHRFVVAEQLREIGINAQIILESAGRNTAPAIALAALHAQCLYKHPVILLVLSADHSIENFKAFQIAVKRAVEIAATGRLVTVGVAPTYPATGYGYIQIGECSSIRGNPVQSFIEKPDRATAEAFIASGDYFWNSGIFAFQAELILSELKTYRNDIYQVCKASMKEVRFDLDFFRIPKEIFDTCPSDSIDYAVMEKTKFSSMVSMDAGWSDVGNWMVLSDLKSKDVQANDTQGDVWLEASENNSIYATSRLIACVGIKNLIIVETNDAVLVAEKAECESIKKLVNRLTELNRSEADLHKEVFRPWGKYITLSEGERFLVKRLTVKPGAGLSLQKHYYRSEHWIVVSGTALVVRGKEKFTVTENESIYIPCGELHRLTNPGCINLEMIEVQSGSYLGEDDIVRIEDVYGRRN